MLHDYPKDIQEASTLKKPSKKQEKASKLFGAVGGLIIFGVLILLIFSILFSSSKKLFIRTFMLLLCFDDSFNEFLEVTT